MTQSILFRFTTVSATAYDLISPDDHTANGNLPFGSRFLCQRNGRIHKYTVFHAVSPLFFLHDTLQYTFASTLCPHDTILKMQKQGNNGLVKKNFKILGADFLQEV
jgi:hypothetical protein